MLFASGQGSYSVNEPSVALDPRGNAVAAWVVGPPGASVLQAVTRAAGSTTWSLPTKLAVGDGRGLTVTFDGEGHLFGAFTRGPWPRNYVQFTEASSVSAPWADPITLSDPEDDGAGSAVAFDRAGDVLVAWTGWYSASSAYGYFIQTTFRRAGSGRWEHPYDLTARGTNSPRGVSVALDQAGNAIAVWVAGGPVADHPVVVAAYRSASTGVWEVPVELAGPLLDVWDAQCDSIGPATQSSRGSQSKTHGRSRLRRATGRWAESGNRPSMFPSRRTGSAT